MYIQQFNEAKWRHIAGKMNPADCASRGLYGDELRDHKLWWNGPQNLLESENFDEFSADKCTTDEEMVVRKVHSLLAINVESVIPRASSFYKLKKNH